MFDDILVDSCVGKRKESGLCPRQLMIVNSFLGSKNKNRPDMMGVKRFCQNLQHKF